MRAVQQNGYTTYKDVANVVSQLNENNPSLLEQIGVDMDSERDPSPFKESHYGKDGIMSISEFEITSQKRAQKQEKNLRRRVYDSLNVLYAVGVLEKQDKKVFCNKTMLAELEEAYFEFDTIDEEKDCSPSSGSSPDYEIKEQPAQKECFKIGDQTLWLEREEAEILRKRIKDEECQLQAKIESDKILNAYNLARVRAKFQMVASMMNQQICLKRVQKRNEKNEQKLLLKLKKGASEQA